MPLQYSGPFFLCQQSLTLSVWQISRLLNAGEGERISNLIQDSSSPHKIYQSRVQLNLSQFNCSVRTAASLYPNISGIWRTLLKRKKTITNWDCKEYMVNMYFLSSLWNKKENSHIPPSACVVLPWLSSAVQPASCFLPGQHQPERGQFRKKLFFVIEMRTGWGCLRGNTIIIIIITIAEVLIMIGDEGVMHVSVCSTSSCQWGKPSTGTREPAS